MSINFKDLLLISANIGSTFEFPNRLFPTWIDSVMKIIQEENPLFIAIHCQEVGGKNYEESMQYVDDFIKLLLTHPTLNCYDKARIYLDEDLTVEEKFTALGSIYFIHESVTNIQQWDFIEEKFVTVEGRELFTANIEHVPHKEKEKFPLEFFPERKWSRKGFMKTRWYVFNRVFDFVNIHLFHDICNLLPILKDPSVYSACRSQAFNYTLKKLTNNFSIDIPPMFIFGDFNFRLNTNRLIKELVEPRTTTENIYKISDEINKIVYRNIESKNINHINGGLHEGNNVFQNGEVDDIILKVGRKTFNMFQYNSWFINDISLFRPYDEEPNQFRNYLHEFDVTFPPSYPFSEDENAPRMYMNTRCPSWCDRIFLNPSALKIVCTVSAVYQMIGLDSPMGDHKPICLSVRLKSEEKPSDIPFDNNEISRTTNDNYNEEPRRSLFIHSHPLIHAGIGDDFQFRKRFSVVDSINGLRASVDVNKYDQQWNIFDNARFCKEKELDLKFRLSHRPYTEFSESSTQVSSTPASPRNVQSLFIQAARNVTLAGNVISAFRQSLDRRRKISDSSTDDENNDDLSVINDNVTVETKLLNCSVVMLNEEDILVETKQQMTDVLSGNDKVSSMEKLTSRSKGSLRKYNTKIKCCTLS